MTDFSFPILLVTHLVSEVWKKNGTKMQLRSKYLESLENPFPMDF